MSILSITKCFMVRKETSNTESAYGSFLRRDRMLHPGIEDKTVCSYEIRHTLDAGSSLPHSTLLTIDFVWASISSAASTLAKQPVPPTAFWWQY